MDKETKENIKQLKREKNYNKIYYLYGAKEYRKNTPVRVQKKEIKQLKNEGKYLDIYNKFGKDAYNKTLVKAMYTEIKENRGTLKASLWRVKENIKNTIKKTLVVATGTLMIAPPAIAVMGAENKKNNYEKNGIEYAEEIEKYNEKINQYADEVRELNLTDVQVFMKVMDDMWENIQGYAVPKKDINGYPELDLADEEGYGVCRNMASDVAQKLNAIDSDYNARTMVVELGHDGDYTLADIKRKQPDIEKENNTEEQENEETVIDKLIPKVFGNHLVTLVDVKEDNIILVLDPTNPGIGVYNNGEITMFNSAKDNGLKFEAKEYSTSFMTGKGGVDNILNTIEDYGKSFKKPNLSMKEMEDKYGLKAQNQALKYEREKSKTKNFKEEIKVEVVENNLEKTNEQNQNKENEMSQEEVR